MNLLEAEINKTMNRMELSQAYAMLDSLGGRNALAGVTIQAGAYYPGGSLMIVAMVGTRWVAGARVSAMRHVLATGYGLPGVREMVLAVMPD